MRGERVKVGKSRTLARVRGIRARVRRIRARAKSTLQVVYQSQKNSWVNTAIFKDWFQNCFVADVKKKFTELGQEPKALLLLDNCSVHPNEDELVSDCCQVSPTKCNVINTTHGSGCFGIPKENLPQVHPEGFDLADRGRYAWIL